MIKPDEELTLEELDARYKGLALVAKLEQDEEFIREVVEGFEQIAAGLDEARALEDKDRTLLGQDNKRWNEE